MLNDLFYIGFYHDLPNADGSVTKEYKKVLVRAVDRTSALRKLRGKYVALRQIANLILE